MGKKRKAEEEARIKKLIEQLKDEKWGVREGAVWTLGRLGKKAAEAIEPLKEAMKEERNKARKFWFAYALVQIEGKEGEGTKAIRRMKEEGELDTWQIWNFNNLCRELKIEEKLER